MNYINLNKDKRIISLVKHFSDKYGENTFKIKDHWESDLCAIGLTDNSEKYLIYISTYGRAKGHFYVSLENLTKNDLEYEDAGDFNDVDLTILDSHFMQHLRIKTL
ncbi:MAG TPA: hypothetical protein VL443_13840 [Cyclobacteriaceae bacterium]|jgi:hypothetical protein|nr:hypothetical protein [Cyclobacteriaceae bacterium]